jgi:hypothetical protein
MKAPPKTLAMALSVLGLLGTRDVVAADLKQHLIAAIDAPDGRSDGELSGRMAEFFKGQTRSSAPVRVQVRTLRKFADGWLCSPGGDADPGRRADEGWQADSTGRSLRTQSVP